MHYVKHFDILGIDTRQITCIELQGKPTTATEGAVGLFGMNMLSADHEVYVCIAVDGAIYTWIPLKGDGGISVTEGKVNDVGELILTLSNGTTINAGVVTGKGCYVNGVPADLNFDSDPQTQIDARVKKEGDTISGILNVEGALTLPNSPDNPEKATVVDTYTSRKTANSNETGLTVVDGSITTIEKIEGSTVKSANLFNKQYVCTDDFANCIETELLDDKNVMIARGKSNDTVQEYNYGLGWVRPLSYQAGYKKSSLRLRAGDIVTISADFTLIENGGRTSAVRCYLYNSDNTVIIANQNQKAISETTQRLSWEFTIKADDDTYFPVFPINSNKVRIENIAIKYGEDATYSTYFSGLKHANFSGIKSTGKNLIPFPYETKSMTVNGLTFTVNNDGTILVNGTATAQTEVTLANNVENLLVDGQTYYFKDIKGADEGLSNGASYFTKLTYVKNGVSTQIVDGSFTYDKATFESNIHIRIRIANGFTLNNLLFEPMLNEGKTALPREPYIEKTYQLPKTIELGKWDSFNPQKGELTRATEMFVFDGSEDWFMVSDGWDIGFGKFYLTLTENVDDKVIVENEFVCPDYPIRPEGVGVSDKEFILTTNSQIRINDPSYTTLADWKAYLQGRYANGNPVIVVCKKETPTIETLLNVPISYTVFDGGTETIVQGEVDNSQWGAIPKITQTYNIHENPKEAANKAYVRNGLAKKLDKTGGKITGTLIVEGGTDTALSALVVKNNDATYGLAYEGDAYKLGQGTVDEKGNFAFNVGEGLPVALRDDSETFTDGHLVVWSAEGNKFVDGGKLPEKVNYTRVYEVILTNVNQNVYYQIEVRFLWFSNHDLELSLEAIMEDILKKIGSVISTTGSGIYYSQTISASQPCSGYVSKGDAYHYGSVERVGVEKVTVGETNPAVGYSVVLIHINKDGNRSMETITDLSAINATIKQLV